MLKKSSNYLLAKTGVGQIKKGFHDLPPSNHTYGKIITKGKQSARQVIFNWKYGQRSPTSDKGRNYVKMNCQGIKKRITNSKQLEQFYHAQQIKIKNKKVSPKIYGMNKFDHQLAHGILNRPSTPIKNIIQNHYATSDQNLTNKTKNTSLTILHNNNKNKSPLKSRFSHKTKHQNIKKQISQNNFKLAQFLNIPSKIKPLTQFNKSNSPPQNHLHSKISTHRDKQNQIPTPIPTNPA